MPSAMLGPHGAGHPAVGLVRGCGIAGVGSQRHGTHQRPPRCRDSARLSLASPAIPTACRHPSHPDLPRCAHVARHRPEAQHPSAPHCLFPHAGWGGSIYRPHTPPNVTPRYNSQLSHVAEVHPPSSHPHLHPAAHFWGSPKGSVPLQDPPLPPLQLPPARWATEHRLVTVLCSSHTPLPPLSDIRDTRDRTLSQPGCGCWGFGFAEPAWQNWRCPCNSWCQAMRGGQSMASSKIKVLCCGHGRQEET